MNTSCSLCIVRARSRAFLGAIRSMGSAGMPDVQHSHISRHCLLTAMIGLHSKCHSKQSRVMQHYSNQHGLQKLTTVHDCCRGMRQGSGGSSQGQAGQGTGTRLSHQNSTGKVALQREQQQMAAQQAQAKLASFQEAAERHSAAAARRRQQQAAAHAAQPRVRRTAPQTSIRPMMQPNTHAVSYG